MMKDDEERGIHWGSPQAKLKLGSGAAMGNKGKWNKENNGNYEAILTRDVTATIDNKERKYRTCQHHGRRNHPHFNCYQKTDMKC